MPNNMVVRTSDVRVSERVCLSNVTLKKNNTVYNDLVDEVSAALRGVFFLHVHIQWLDQCNIFCSAMYQIVPCAHCVLAIHSHWSLQFFSFLLTFATCDVTRLTPRR